MDLELAGRREVIHAGHDRGDGPIERPVARGGGVDDRQRVSIGRMVTAEEVAWVVTFLAGPRSDAITDDTIVAGGGARGSIYY